MPVYPEYRPGQYDFQAEAQWIRASGKYLNASTEAEKAAQARRVIVPKVVQFLSALNALPNEYHSSLRVPFTNYTSWQEVKEIEVNRPQQDQAARAAVPMLRKLLEVTQHQLVDTQLQAAVETDKSARPVDPAILAFARAVSSYQSVDWIRAKKDPTVYLTPIQLDTGVAAEPKPLANNTRDPVGRMVEQTNRYYAQAEVAPAQTLSAYNIMVPKPTNTVLHSSARAMTRTYNQLIGQANQIKQAAQLNPGLKLTISSPELPSPITVTNLTTFNPKGDAPIWQAIRENQALQLQILPNDVLYGLLPKESHAWKTQESRQQAATHNYQVVALIPDAQGRLESYSVGTLERESERQLVAASTHAKSQNTKRPVLKKASQSAQSATEEVEVGEVLKAGHPITVSRMDLSPNYDRQFAEELITQAETEARLWVESIQPEDRAEAFRSLYHANESETGRQTAGTNGRYLAMRLFPDQMVPHLQQYSLTSAKVTGLNHHADKLGAEVRWQGQMVPIRAAICDDPAEQVYGQPIWQVGVDEPQGDSAGYQRQWYTIGVVPQSHPRPPIGVEAVAQIQAEQKYGARFEDGTLLVIAPNPNEAARRCLQDHDLAQPALLRFTMLPSDANRAAVFYYPGGDRTSEPIEVGRLEVKSTEHLKNQDKAFSQSGDDCFRSLPLELVPAQVAAITIQPQNVDRPQQ